jgi:hypothetical protein
MLRTTTLSLLLVAMTACGLSQHAGNQAARGISNEVEADVSAAQAKGCPYAECLSRSAVKGAVTQLDTPEQRAQIQAIIQGAVQDVLTEMSSPEQLAQVRMIAENAARSAMAGFLGGNGGMPSVDSITNQTVSAVRRSLGADGNGPLSDTLAATAERVSASTVRGIRGEMDLFPECTGPNRHRCVDERLTALSRAASIGVREGLRGLIAIPVVAFSFLLGLVVALLVSRLWHHGEPTRGHRRAHAHASAH